MANTLPKKSNPLQQNKDTHIINMLRAPKKMGNQNAVIQVDGMDCSDCAFVIEHRLSRLPGVKKVDVDYGQQIVFVEYDSKKLSFSDLSKSISQLGYLPVVKGVRAWWKSNQDILFSVLAGLVLFSTWLGEIVFDLPRWLSLSGYSLVYILVGSHIVRHTFSALLKGRFDTHLLMVLAAAGAAILGDLAEGGLLLFLFSLGHGLENKVVNRARKAIRALGEFMPRQALVQIGSEQKILPTDKINPGDIVIVRPGERIPMDGSIIQGESSVNQAPITGESLPVEKYAGSKVFAGTINGEGVLEIQVDKLARDSTLARVMSLVEQAQALKSPSQQLVERFSKYFVPFVLITSILLILFPFLLGDPFSSSFRRSMIFLVAVSPCALAIGTPAAIMAGVAKAAHNGVLIKGGVHLENLGLLTKIIFDKTGTLTMGLPKVQGIYPSEWWTECQVLGLAAAIEKNSNHLLAKAVLTEAKLRSIQISDAEQVRLLPGLGAQGLIHGNWLFVGNDKLLAREKIKPDENWLKQKTQVDATGYTYFWVGGRDGIIGMITLSDSLRSESKKVIDHLKELGITDLQVLSGDNELATRSIAEQVGIQDFLAGLMPEEKLKQVSRSQREQKIIAMVGDGINDAPALAAADVGIAIGGAGTDVALEAADVALMAANLDKLPFSIALGRQTRKVIFQNLGISFSAILILGVIALGGWSGMGPVVLFHEGSTLLVVLNALRLLNFDYGLEHS